LSGHKGMDKVIKPGWLAGAAAFLAWSLVFAIIYAQSPLYTSNQNQYFLHGLASAGFGYLGHDWLANTVDPLPLFSLIVHLTQLICASGWLFYLYYALLMGVYLVGMLGIADRLFDLRGSRNRHLAFLVLFLLIHSAALHFALSRLLGMQEPFLLEGGVASQRLLGQVLQPSTFGVFIILSISLFLRKRRFLSLVAMAVAVAFHSVYLLCAALLTLGFMWAIFREERSLKQPILFGLGALALVAPVVAYTIFIFKPTSGEIIQEVNAMLVTFRNPHHAIVAEWLDWSVLVQAAIVCGALFVIRKKRLFAVLAVMVLGTALLTVVQVVTNSNALALLYPWRTSVILVPVSTCILLAFLVTRIAETWKRKPAEPQRSRWVGGLSLVILSVLIIIGVLRFRVELDRQQAGAAVPMMRFVSENKSEQHLYLVPADAENFRLATGAPIFAEFKAVPYRDTDVQEWYRRMLLVYSFYKNRDDPCEVIRYLASGEGITHIVLPADNREPLVCDSLQPVHEDEHYGVYHVDLSP